MQCLIRTGSAFMEYEHREAIIFSNNKLALQSIAKRINPFTHDEYKVIDVCGLPRKVKSVIFCHQDDSDINYSIIHDDLFFEDTLPNEKSLKRTIDGLIKQHGATFSLTKAEVKNEITKEDMAEVFRSVGGDFVRHIRSYDDFCTLESGYKRMKAGIVSPEFYESNDFANSIFSYQGYNLGHFDCRR
ncbi:hypothetical protein OTK49_28455 [Vibrio coralliirubri]|uniref:hypothetical protein n=1 Tax=Vibrio coralliirubri TaxID=1516159 RepID=UPI002285135E|nr:hypothetical protein [Vibrio coralliirubri]MCY9866476.1 hypothetical protein [Vibrio coralliirubri]